MSRSWDFRHLLYWLLLCCYYWRAYFIYLQFTSGIWETDVEHTILELFGLKGTTFLFSFSLPLFLLFDDILINTNLRLKAVLCSYMSQHCSQLYYCITCNVEFVLHSIVLWKLCFYVHYLQQQIHELKSES